MRSAALTTLVVLLGGSACSKARDAGGRDAAAPPPAPPGVTAVAVAPPVDAATSDAPPGAELVVSVEPPRPGTSTVLTFDATLDFDLNFGGFATVTSSRQSKRKKVVIVAVDPDGTVHKRITYLERKTHIVVDGEPKKDRTILPGKTFRVAVKDGVTTVRRANGKAATAAEIDAVKKEELLLQTPEVLGRILANLRLVEGQPYEVPASLMEVLITSDYRPRRIVMTYMGKVGDASRIDAQASLENDGEGFKMFVDLDAEVLVDRTGWCLQADVTGQIRAEFGGVVVGSGAGIATMKSPALK